MRAFTVFACLLLAGLGAARAADLPPAPEGGVRHYDFALGRRVAPLIIYDYEPGVVVRAYWLPPWRHRHYLPASNEVPVTGRDEDLSAEGAPPEPAESYSRSWSTSSAFLPERVPLPERPLK